MPTKVGGEVYGEGQRKRKSARRSAWRVRILFFGFYALLVTRFSLSIRRVRGREARCCTPKLGTVLTALTIHLFVFCDAHARVGVFVLCIHDMLLIVYVLDSLFFATPKSKRVLMHVWRHMLLTLWFVDSLYLATPKSRRVCFVFGRAQVPSA